MSFSQSDFLKSFFEYLNENEVRYAVARNASTLPESIPGSDIDLLIHPADFRHHRSAISCLAVENGYRRWKCYRKNHSILQISFAPDHCNDPELVVRLDFLMGGIFWFGLPVLSAEQWMAGRVLKNDVWQIEGPLMIAATLANTWVYGGRVKERYVHELAEFPDTGKQETKNVLKNLFGDLATDRVDALSQGDLSYDCQAMRRKCFFCKPWKLLGVPLGLAGMVRTLLARLMHPPGVFVVLHGPDGCGKSAVSEGLKSSCADLFSDILHFHLFPKPAFLRKLDGRSHERWEDRQKSANEWELRQQTRGTLRSLVQIVYLTFRYWAGYLFCVYPALMKGKLILGERWNLDFLSDPASKGIFLPLGVRRFFYALCPHPEKLVLLTGDANAMAARKIELPSEEIARQINLNRSLFGKSRRTVFVDSTVEFEQTLSQVLCAIIGK